MPIAREYVLYVATPDGRVHQLRGDSVSNLKNDARRMYGHERGPVRYVLKHSGGSTIERGLLRG
jgi:hypothetical protein